MEYAFIYIQIADTHNVEFSIPLLNKLKETYPTVTFFDLDNHSEPIMIDHAVRLIKECDHVVVVFDKRSGTPQKTLKIIEAIISNKKKCHSILIGQDALLQKMLKVAGEFHEAKNEQAAEKKIQELLTGL